MLFQDLLPTLPGLHIEQMDTTPSLVTVWARTTALSVPCPLCHTSSSRVQSRYTRTLADKPFGRIPLQFRITVRRFHCCHPECPRAIFAESLDPLAGPYARTTLDLAEAHTAIGFTAGGEPGARLARVLNMPTSPDTLLRRIKAHGIEPSPPPRFIGIDDWVLRKGQNYGTMIVDLERQCVIALLPGREAEPLAQWLREHSQVEVIARDRWPAYAKAAREAAPQAKPVADRWHLLKNLRESLEGFLARLGPEIHAAAMPAEMSEPTLTTTPAPTPQPTRVETPAQQAKRQARRERRQRVRDLKANGFSVREIARHLRMSGKTVVHILRTSDDDRPHGNLGRRGPSRLDTYRSDIEAWLASDSTNTAELYRRLKAKGCSASYTAVCRYANRWLESSGIPGRRRPTRPRQKPAEETPSARWLSFEFACPKKFSENSVPSLLDRVRHQIPVLDAGLKLAGEFADMIRRKVTTTLSEWLVTARSSGIVEWERFASGLEEDAVAVSAAMTERWSNGPVEGQVNRLKAIKRSMYGRAGLNLLRARVLNKA